MKTTKRTERTKEKGKLEQLANFFAPIHLDIGTLVNGALLLIRRNSKFNQIVKSCLTRSCRVKQN